MSVSPDHDDDDDDDDGGEEDDDDAGGDGGGGGGVGGGSGGATTTRVGHSATLRTHRAGNGRARRGGGDASFTCKPRAAFDVQAVLTAARLYASEGVGVTATFTRVRTTGRRRCVRVTCEISRNLQLMGSRRATIETPKRAHQNKFNWFRPG
eukprot:6059337-Pleurochrysis_carterae.AAC.1